LKIVAKPDVPHLPPSPAARIPADRQYSMMFLTAGTNTAANGMIESKVYKTKANLGIAGGRRLFDRFFSE
jgi:hypothetical protein